MIFCIIYLLRTLYGVGSASPFITCDFDFSGAGACERRLINFRGIVAARSVASTRSGEVFGVVIVQGA